MVKFKALPKLWKIRPPDGSVIDFFPNPRPPFLGTQKKVCNLVFGMTPHLSAQQFGSEANLIFF